MPDKVPGSTPRLVGECSHSKFLPFGAFAMLMLYWAAKYPPVDSVVPHLAGTTNIVAGSLSFLVGGQSVKQTKGELAKLFRWLSCHVEISGPVTIRLGEKEGKPPP